MDFYPPHELPPMQNDAPCERAGRPVTRRRIAMFIGVSVLLGLVLAVAMYWAFGNIVVVSLIPITAASGWYFGTNPLTPKLTSSPRDAGPVLW